ncbi:hypothetical protein MA16_Dca009066 [Dendrobium catenatum]|uniref:GRF-type domain-containing protein n=1 Tax=Dendrobium catenatum TaxID=906689 RepID=A0A2I0VRG2_9ASPA|nr:hypothetical protein MA16_Dca009066 [Dendrobium catenatum]
MRNPDNPVYYRCNLQCPIFTCYKANNCGRKFYRCPWNRSEDGCGYFRWFEKLNNLPNDMNGLRNSNALEIRSNHAVSITSELLQIKILLVIWIFLVAVAVNSLSKGCNCKF